MAENESVSLYLDTELIAVLRARAKAAGMSFSSFVGEQLQSSLEDAPKRVEAKPTAAAVSKEQIVKAMRDALKSIKKVSPIKTELVELLSSFLKDGPAVDHSQTTIVPMSEPVLDEEAEREMDDFLEQRRQANVGRAGGMQPISAAGSMFAPGGALERAANRGGVDPNEFREMFKTSKPNETPEPADDDDWYPDE